MSKWHQCTGEPPRESSGMTSDTEAEALPGRAWADYIRDGSRRIAAMQAELAATEQAPAEPPAPEVRCPECGGACARRRNLDHFECPGEDCQWRGAGHEVWRRPEDVAEAGKYWVVWAHSDKMTLGQLLKVEMVRSNIRWVLGPLPEPHAPGVE